ncbi:MAG: biotin transporter BioY [Methanosphaera sp.]|uniref:biotin transporter BioY n=1 Tax=Methanosphaera sp. TaxID=2666342 RepID=UPI0025F956EC|nr:biotin transporter BioY [Methanosphaera sp.]MCI5867468.1 biotin transporter BioY [Methanosphaera sp.]MDD6534464.1 biotin transporter BioY [Methanosphaera sp.]MDY3955867.1 biotin transporter BioY [Methanosphaera sp.]
MFINVNKLHEVQNSWYDWRNNASTATMVALSFVFACFTGIMAQVAITVPWSPVLITFQTFAALMAGTMLGKKYGVFSMLLYLVLGVAGVPWFTNMHGGIEGILTASGGYIFGFIFAAAFTGYVFDTYSSARKPMQTVLVMLIANWVFIYIPGLIGLYMFMSQKMAVVSLGQLLLAGVVPFVFGDTLKVLLASGISTSILPKEE